MPIRTPINSRDKFLQTIIPRLILYEQANTLYLVSNFNEFRYTEGNTPVPPTIKVSALLRGSVLFTVNNPVIFSVTGLKTGGNLTLNGIAMKINGVVASLPGTATSIGDSYILSGTGNLHTWTGSAWVDTTTKPVIINTITENSITIRAEDFRNDYTANINNSGDNSIKIDAELKFLGVTYTATPHYLFRRFVNPVLKIIRSADYVVARARGTEATDFNLGLIKYNKLTLVQGYETSEIVVTEGVTYGPASQTKNGLTVNVNSTTGAITVTQTGVWTSLLEEFILTATKNTVTYSTQYTVSKLNESAIIDTTPPPKPSWSAGTSSAYSLNAIKVTAGISNIQITIDRADLAYTTNTPVNQDGTTNTPIRASSLLEPNQNSFTSTHKSVIVYITKLASLDLTPGFSDLYEIIGEFNDLAIFSIAAESGSNYALFFKYRSKAGVVSIDAAGPYKVSTGADVQKLIDVLADQITEGMLYKGLQQRLDRTDRDPQVLFEQKFVKDQYTVKIDKQGAVAGFGFGFTSPQVQQDSTGSIIGNQLQDSNFYSEFGVIADRFWIGAPAVLSSSAPTTNLYHGATWINTSSSEKGVNEGQIYGVKAIYDTYDPSIFNTNFRSSVYHYWQKYTKTQLDTLIQNGNNLLINKGVWSSLQAYLINDYIFDVTNNVYYVCIKGYTPALLSNLSLKNPNILGGFSASGASIAVDKTVYIEGIERLAQNSTEITGAGEGAGFKLGGSYNSLGTYYYVVSGNSSEFVLSLVPSGKPITTQIKPKVQYYNLVKNADGTVNTGASGWLPIRQASMFPFIVKTTGDRAGVYMQSAYIEDATITGAKIKQATIDDSHIINLNASKINAGLINADRIVAGSLSAKQIDISSLRGKLGDSWTIVMPKLISTQVSKTVDLPPGQYTLTIQSNFFTWDRPIKITVEGNASNQTSVGTENHNASDSGMRLEVAKIKGELLGTGNAVISDVEAWGYYDKRTFLSFQLYEVEDDEILIDTYPTVSAVTASGTIPKDGGDWEVDVTPTLSGGTFKLKKKDLKRIGDYNENALRGIQLSTVDGKTNILVPAPGGSFTLRLKEPVIAKPSFTWDNKTGVTTGADPTTAGTSWAGDWIHGGTILTLTLDSINTAAVTVTGPTSINEGATGTFTVTATDGVEKGDSLQWQLIHDGISNNSHYEASSLLGSISMSMASPPVGTIQIKPINDFATTPAGSNKQFKLRLFKGATQVHETGNVTVNDTSKGPAYSLSLSPTSVNEGGQITGTVTVTNPLTIAHTIEWSLTDIASIYRGAANRYFETSGLINIPANGTSAQFKINIYNDYADNPSPKTFKVKLTVNGVDALNSSGQSVVSGTITVNDTSKSGGINNGSLIGVNLAAGPPATVANNSSQDAYTILDIDPDGTFTITNTDSTGQSINSANWFTGTIPPGSVPIGSSYFINISSTILTDAGYSGRFQQPSSGWYPINKRFTIAVYANGYSRCVDLDADILLDYKGQTKLAKDLEIGDSVYTMHEKTKYWGFYKILHKEIILQPKVLVTFEDNTTLFASVSHQIYQGYNTWTELQCLNIGDIVIGHDGMKKITDLVYQQPGPVVSFEIEHAHTYVANNIISHNKSSTREQYYAKYERTFAVLFSNTDGGGGSSSSSNVFVLGAQVGTAPAVSITYPVLPTIIPSVSSIVSGTASASLKLQNTGEWYIEENGDTVVGNVGGVVGQGTIKTTTGRWALISGAADQNSVISNQAHYYKVTKVSETIVQNNGNFSFTYKNQNALYSEGWKKIPGVPESIITMTVTNTSNSFGQAQAVYKVEISTSSSGTSISSTAFNISINVSAKI